MDPEPEPSRFRVHLTTAPLCGLPGPWPREPVYHAQVPLAAAHTIPEQMRCTACYARADAPPVANVSAAL